MTTLVLYISRCHSISLIKCVACVATLTTSEETTSESPMVQMPMMLQIWLRAGRLRRPPPPVKPFWYLTSVTHWKRLSMPVTCTVETSSLVLGPLLPAYQLWEQRATSGAVWPACALLMVTQGCYVRHYSPTLVSARRLELLYPYGGTPHSAVCCFTASCFYLSASC